jgi:hypothetical protein
MNSNAIIECSKRYDDSENHQKLIDFFDDFKVIVLENLNKGKFHPMDKWSGKDWIKQINEKNPIISLEIYDEFENYLNDEFTKYAIEIKYTQGHFVYELCGVYWILYSSDLEYDNEVTGPSTDKDWIISLLP